MKKHSLAALIPLASAALLAVVAFVPHLAFADDSFHPLTQIPGLSTLGNTPNLSLFINEAYRLCIGAAAVIAILQIMRGGAILMTTQASFAKNKEAKAHISNALIGLLLVLSPWLVFGLINPSIRNIDLNFGKLQSTPTASSPAGATTATPATAASCDATYSSESLINGSDTSVCSTFGTGWTSAPAACCSSATAGFVCCGKPK